MFVLHDDASVPVTFPFDFWNATVEDGYVFHSVADGIGRTPLSGGTSEHVAPAPSHYTLDHGRVIGVTRDHEDGTTYLVEPTDPPNLLRRIANLGKVGEPVGIRIVSGRYYVCIRKGGRTQFVSGDLMNPTQHSMLGDFASPGFGYAPWVATPAGLFYVSGDRIEHIPL
jgi:hypothetical protein